MIVVVLWIILVFIMGRPQVYVGRIAYSIIFWPWSQIRGKIIRGGLLGPGCENEKNLPMIRETWKTFQRGGLLRPKKMKKKKKKKKKRKEKILLRIREPFTMLTLSYTKLLSKVHLSMKSSWTSNEQDKLAGTNHPH